MNSTYELRRDGMVLLRAEGVRSLGYTTELLIDMERCGYALYRDGKRLRAKNIQFLEETK